MGNITDPETARKSITVSYLFESNKERVKLSQLDGLNGFENEISDKNLHRPGLALAGYVDLFTFDRVQIVGNTEVKYLNSLRKENAFKAFARILDFPIPCIIITNNNELPSEMIALSDRKSIRLNSSHRT